MTSGLTDVCRSKRYEVSLRCVLSATNKHIHSCTKKTYITKKKKKLDSTTDSSVTFSAGHTDAARGGELPASVPQRDAAGQQCGVYEGEGQRSTNNGAMRNGGGGGGWVFNEYQCGRAFHKSEINQYQQFCFLLVFMCTFLKHHESQNAQNYNSIDNACK